MPAGWAATAAAVLRRDPTCWCGAPTTEVHHLVPGDDDPRLLRGLCHDCHLAVTQRQAAAARALARP